MSRRLPPIDLLLPLLAAAAALALLLADPLPLRALRYALYDQYQRWHPRPYQAQPVRIIDVDEESLQRLGQWPWPRTRLAELVDRLAAAQVAAIGFDMIFAERDRTSPAQLAASWPLAGDARRAIAALPDHDRVFAASIARAPVVLSFAVAGRAPASANGAYGGGGGGGIGASEPAPAAAAKAGDTERRPAQPGRFVFAGAAGERWRHDFDFAASSLPELERAAAGNGALSFVADADGVVRRVPLVLGLSGQPVATLVSELLRVAQQQRNIVLKAAPPAASGLAEVAIGAYRIPTNANGELWLHYSPPVAGRTLPAWRVLAGEVPAQQLKGQLVLLGSSAQGLMDLRFSPLGRVVPGVEVHAQALEQVLAATYLQRPAWAGAGEAIVVVAATLLVGFVALRARALSAALLAALLLAAVHGAGWLFFRHYGLLLDAVTPTLALAATFVAGSLVHHRVSERRQRWIRAAFSRYVSPNLVTHLVAHPDDMVLGGRRQECSFVFTDLAGFTALMEKTDPGDAVARLNAYLDGMIAIAFAHDGTLDRIVGDAVAIMFSAPLRQDDHRARALACALEMDRYARRYVADLAAQGIEFGKTRIGIHTGVVIVGNFGGSTIFDYRALGDAVNTAARLEGANKALGTTLCLSQETLAGCPPGTPVRPVGRLLLQGKRLPLLVHEPLTQPAAASGYAPDAEYAAAYALMAGEADEGVEAGEAGEVCARDGRAGSPALALFERLALRYPADPLAALHCRRLRAGGRGDLVVIDGK